MIRSCVGGADRTHIRTASGGNPAALSLLSPLAVPLLLKPGLYYQDSYGRTHRSRSAERSRSLPAAPVAKFLMILAVLVVLASLVH